MWAIQWKSNVCLLRTLEVDWTKSFLYLTFWCLEQYAILEQVCMGLVNMANS